MHCEHIPMVECVIPFIIGKVQFPVEQPINKSGLILVRVCKAINDASHQRSIYERVHISITIIIICLIVLRWHSKRHLYCGLLAIRGT
jgi:hypothetical protein